MGNPITSHDHAHVSTPCRQHSATKQRVCPAKSGAKRDMKLRSSLIDPQGKYCQHQRRDAKLARAWVLLFADMAKIPEGCAHGVWS